MLVLLKYLKKIEDFMPIMIAELKIKEIKPFYNKLLN
jgi:hypothetical protein